MVVHTVTRKAYAQPRGLPNICLAIYIDANRTTSDYVMTVKLIPPRGMPQPAFIEPCGIQPFSTWKGFDFKQEEENYRKVCTMKIPILIGSLPKYSVHIGTYM